MPDAAGYALEFVSGRFQGTSVPLPEGAEVLLGRESDADVVLQEDMVSRRHAKIAVRGGEILLTDLGSTNGTFVNGQKVKRVRIAEGDRVLVGTSLMKVVRADAAPATSPLPRATRRPTAMQGRVEEIPLPDLLQLLAASRKTGVLAVADAAGEARVHVAEGRVAACALAAAPELAPRKAFARLLAIDRGAFELRPAEPPPPAAALDAPLEALLMDGARQLDEWRAVAPRLPGPGARVAAAPQAPPLRDLTPEELDVYQLALEAGTVQRVLDRSAAPDGDVAERLLALAEKGYLRLG
jgi:hypothetical protein